MLRLPTALREELKAPAGPIHADVDTVLAVAGRPVYAVGDVVTRHLLTETTPAVALIDGRTKRSTLGDDHQVDADRFDRRVDVTNPPGKLSAALLDALGAAIERSRDGTATTVIVVDGEEDLAAIPAIAAAPDGASVVYGQPDAGMVLVTVDGETRGHNRRLMARMDGDVAEAFAALNVPLPTERELRATETEKGEGADTKRGTDTNTDA